MKNKLVKGRNLRLPPERERETARDTPSSVELGGLIKFLAMNRNI